MRDCAAVPRMPLRQRGATVRTSPPLRDACGNSVERLRFTCATCQAKRFRPETSPQAQSALVLPLDSCVG